MPKPRCYALKLARELSFALPQEFCPGDCLLLHRRDPSTKRRSLFHACRFRRDLLSPRSHYSSFYCRSTIVDGSLRLAMSAVCAFAREALVLMPLTANNNTLRPKGASHKATASRLLAPCYPAVLLIRYGARVYNQIRCTVRLAPGS